MSNILTIAYSAEGNTDQRFLESIIKRTFEEIAFKCDGIIEVFDPIYIKLDKRDGFISAVCLAALQAFKDGINVLCIHADADSYSDNEVAQNKIIPAFDAIAKLDTNACKNLVAIIPVQMSEAWMLADKELLKEEIDTIKSNEDLGLTRAPETISDPKETIKTAIRNAQKDSSKRRDRISINELYQPIGQKISLDKLESLPSFVKFKCAVEDAFKKLNYLH